MTKLLKRIAPILAIGLFLTLTACEKEVLKPNYNKESNPPPGQNQNPPNGKGG